MESDGKRRPPSMSTNQRWTVSNALWDSGRDKIEDSLEGDLRRGVKGRIASHNLWIQ